MQNEFLAAADCGSNSFHMIVVKMKKDSSFEIAAREREIIRLGNTKDNLIPIDVIERAIFTLKRFKKIAQSYDAPLAVVATSAVRNSINKEELIKRIFDETGIDVKVLSGLEEAKLTFTGITKAITSENNILCIDIGGGSTELIIGSEGKIQLSESIELGAVSLSRKFFNDDYSYSEEQFDKCYMWTLGEIGKIANEDYYFEKVIGASGTIISAASMVTGGKTDLNNYHLKREGVRDLAVMMLKNKTVEMRKVIPGLEVSRADIIPAGIIILKAIFEVFGFEEMIISMYGLREGIIVEYFLRNRQ